MRSILFEGRGGSKKECL